MMDLKPLAQDLKDKGWHFSDSLVPLELCEDLLSQLLEHQQANALKKAHIGQGVETQIQKEIRGDFIRWMDFEKPTAYEKKFADWLDLFLQNLRPELLLGLGQYEFHYAFYPPETRYEKHIDVFKKDSARKISFVLYLNKNWAASDGGELVLFEEQDPTREAQRISPHFGHLVVFLCDAIYHQVNFTNRERFSVTGWLKNRL
jgi:SM-20-related protein